MNIFNPSPILSVFLNGHISRRRLIDLNPNTTIKALLQDCVEKFKLPPEGKYRLFDAQGGELDNDDIEFLTSDEPLFLSRGEDFIKSSSLAVYEELETLGKGGFGTVQLYKHRLNHEFVAIKFVNLSQIQSTLGLARVYKEVQILRTLSHANIVEMKDAFSIGSHMCFVMEYCKGGELGKLLTNLGPLSEDQVYGIVIQIIDGMMYCHNAGVVHRDLKLENILFADSMKTHIKIVDFGIAGMFTVGGASDQSGAGSIRYIAPEVLSGYDKSSHPALDIWSIGCIIYALLTGKLPFEGENRDIIMEKIVSVTYKPLPGRISTPWKHLINGIFRKDPRKRWPLYKIDEFLRMWRGETNFEKLGQMSNSESEEEDKSPEVQIRAHSRQGFPKKLKPISKSLQSYHLSGRKQMTLGSEKPLRRMLSPILSPSGASKRPQTNAQSRLRLNSDRKNTYSRLQKLP